MAGGEFGFVRREFHESIGVEQASEVAGSVEGGGMRTALALFVGGEFNREHESQWSRKFKCFGQTNRFAFDGVRVGHLAERREDITVQTGVGGNRITGQGEDRRISRGGAKPQGLAGTLGDASESLGGTEVSQDRGHMVFFTLRNAAGEDHDIELG